MSYGVSISYTIVSNGRVVEKNRTGIEHTIGAQTVVRPGEGLSIIW